MHHSKIQVPDGDILIHAGDFCSHGDFLELISINTWLGTLPHKHKILIPGNHDRCTQEDPAHARVLLSNATVLIDEEITVEGIRIYGSPWTPTFGYWNWMAPRGEAMAEKWAKIPAGLDVLVSHGPPAGILDTVLRFNGKACEWQPESAGCQDLYNRVMDVRPRYHVFGHIHEAAGRAEENGIQFINAATCDVRYKPVNPPVVFQTDQK